MSWDEEMKALEDWCREHGRPLPNEKWMWFPWRVDNPVEVAPPWRPKRD